MNTLKILALTSTAFVAIATAPFAQAAGPETADQHAAMAREAQQKAAVANQKAVAHEVMARTGGSPKSTAGSMERHCDKLIAKYKAEAAKYSAEAAEHAKHAGSTVVTREQHLALAEQFDAKAAAAKKKAAEHEVMSRTASPKGNKMAMENHCEELITQYQAEADVYAAKAAEHRLAAK
jgi:hypothetical protein